MGHRPLADGLGSGMQHRVYGPKNERKGLACRFSCGHRHPDSWVDVLVPYLPRGGCLQVEHHPVRKGSARPCQPGEEAFQDVKLDQLVDRASVLAGLPAQIEIGLSGYGGARRCRHSSTARAWRSAGSE